MTKNIILIFILLMCFVGCEVKEIDNSMQLVNKSDLEALIQYNIVLENQNKELKNKDNVIEYIYQYQCYDGSFKDSYMNCAEILKIEYYNLTENNDFCMNESNYNYQEIEITNFLYSVRKEGDSIISSSEKLDKKSNLGDFEAWVKWYPSLNEGFIFGYLIQITNIGCTKLDISKFKSSIYLYYDDDLIFKDEYADDAFFSLYNDIYPDDFFTGKILLGDYSYKINKQGNYGVKVVIYYDNEIISIFEDIIFVHD